MPVCMMCVFMCVFGAGTGALRIAADFIARELKDKLVYIPEPTWENHIKIFNDSGVTCYLCVYALAPLCVLFLSALFVMPVWALRALCE